jgi:hypothetical protein
MRKQVLFTAAAVVVGLAAAIPASAHPDRQVLLISVDGLHQNDLEWFIANHPASTLARLASQGVEYTQALTPFPSDSFPGMVGQVTGGNPKTTGIYYDDAFSRNLLPPGTTSCAGAAPGAEVQYAENVDKDQNRLDAGQNIPGLYASVPTSFSLIAQLTSNARDLIDPTQLPVDPGTCLPVYPHQYLKVNTIFEVAHSKGLRTAWSDKHPAYEILSGPSGTGVDEFFTPEINSSTTNPPDPPIGPGPDFTKDNINTQLYDGFKVTAVLNWINGRDHSGNVQVGSPSLFGMNFQSISTAQKLNKSRYCDPANPGTILSGGLGGYTLDAQGHLIPGPVLHCALLFVDASIGEMVQALDMSTTVVIVSAKHGQSPENRADLTIINDNNMLDALNAAWKTATGSTTDLVAHAIDDDGVLMWLSVHTQQAANFAAEFLMGYSGVGVGSDASGNPVPMPFTSAGLSTIYAGAAAAGFMGVAANDPLVPDVIGIAKQGSVYAGSKLSKISEHGGNASQDRHVALIVAGAGIAPAVIGTPVETTQIAPTILKMLHLSPNKLDAVKAEGTNVLPGL